MKKENFDIKGINEISLNELNKINGGSLIRSIMHGIGYLLGSAAEIIDTVASGMGNYMGD